MSDQMILVAMSGGVDSSVAAALLVKQGCRAVGVSMQVWDYRNHGGSLSKATCCAPSDFSDARLVANKVGIPYYVFDFEDSFKEKVIDKFVESYRQGLTPNPCVECNRKVKFAELRNRAKLIGASKVATGHYARIIEDQSGYKLLRGKDDSKDQSYFLWALSQQEMSQTLFPVGDMTKSEVREFAKELGLATAEKAESQDICFVSGKLKNFLSRMGVSEKAGDIVNNQGQVVGTHEGIHSFTVGQRRGINIGGSDSPLYVLEIDALNSRVVVGHKKELETEKFYVSEQNFCDSILEEWWSHSQDEFECLAQIRYRHRGVPVGLRRKGQIIEVTFKSESSAVSPGQFAVFYCPNNIQVLGGGRILHKTELNKYLD